MRKKILLNINLGPPTHSEHIFDFKYLDIITFIKDKNKRRIIRSFAISHYNIISQRSGFYKISPYLVKIMLKDFNLQKR